MRPDDATLVRVHSEWDSWRTSRIPLSALEEIHWFQPIGAPRRLVHGYVSCEHITPGDLPHDCPDGDPRHRLRVCVLRVHTSEGVYAELERRADARTSDPKATARPVQVSRPSGWLYTH